MKKILATITLTLMLTGIGSQAFAWGYSSSPNIFGGYNYSGNGWSGSSSPNIFGGYNYTFNNPSPYYNWNW